MTNEQQPSDTTIFSSDNPIPLAKEEIDALKAYASGPYTASCKKAEKDINDMVLVGHDPKEIEKIIKENAANGLMARLKLSTWRQI